MLIEWLSSSAEYQGDGWLYVKSNENAITENTLCWPGVVESIDLADEEYDEMESWIEQNGFKLLLGKEQIEDVASNLEQQISNYTMQQFVEAINYYWEYDAFIRVKNA